MNWPAQWLKLVMLLPREILVERVVRFFGSLVVPMLNYLVPARLMKGASKAAKEGLIGKHVQSRVMEK
jgi:hypothetical protein